MGDVVGGLILNVLVFRGRRGWLSSGIFHPGLRDIFQWDRESTALKLDFDRYEIHTNLAKPKG